MTTFDSLPSATDEPRPCGEQAELFDDPAQAWLVSMFTEQGFSKRDAESQAKPVMQKKIYPGLRDAALNATRGKFREKR